MKGVTILVAFTLAAAAAAFVWCRAAVAANGPSYGGSPYYGSPCCVDYYWTRAYEFGYFQPSWRPWPVSYASSTTSPASSQSTPTGVSAMAGAPPLR